MKLLFGYQARGAPASATNPIAKLSMLITISVVATVNGHVSAQVLLLLGVFLAVVVACGIRLRDVGILAWVALGLNATLFLVQAAVIHGGAILFNLGPLTVTTHGLAVASTVAIRRVTIFVAAMGFVATTSPRDLASSLHHQARLPFWFTLMLFITLRYLSRFDRVISEAKEALIARGAMRRGEQLVKPRQAIFFLRLLLFRGLLEGRTLALSLDSRGFRMLPYRTYRYVPTLGKLDRLIVAAAFGAIVSSIWIRIYYG